MVQILNDIGAGEKFGSALGQGLSEGLERLSRLKMDKMQRSQTAQGLRVLGVPENQAEQLVNLDPRILQEYTKYLIQQPERESFAQALSYILGIPYTPKQAQQNFTQEAMQEPGGITQQLSTRQSSQQSPLNTSMKQSINQPIPGLSQVKPQEAIQLANLQAQKQQRESQQELAKAKLEQQERHHKENLSHSEEVAANKESLPYYRQVMAASRENRDTRNRLNRMEEITKRDIEKGTLSNPTKRAVVDFFKNNKFFKVDLTPLLSGDTQELAKLTADFARGAAAALRTGKLTNMELGTFMQSVPNLMQSNEGRLRVIANMRVILEMIDAEKEAMTNIIKENGGKRPANLEILVDERVAPKLDDLTEKFKTTADEAIAGIPSWGKNKISLQNKETLTPKSMVPEDYMQRWGAAKESAFGNPLVALKNALQGFPTGAL